jgi:ATP/maltotriose-dependent transcriptional regulator MalT
VRACYAALRMQDSARVLEEVGSDNVLGKELVGNSPRVGALHVRAQALIFLGRLPEAWNQVEAAERVAVESRELEVFTWMQVTRAMLEYTCGRPESGLEHGRRSLEIAEKLDNEASRMAAYAALGLANLVEGQPAAARDALRESATIARDRRVVRGLLPLVLAGLAQANLALGEPTEAATTRAKASIWGAPVAASTTRRLRSSLWRRPCWRRIAPSHAPRSSPLSNAPSTWSHRSRVARCRREY